MSDSTQTDWRPTASLETLALRAALLREVRLFFDEAGYLEVETPILSQDIVVDAHLEPFVVQPETTRRTKYFLQTSPEFHMKRLLAAGATAIYQIARVMRSGELGQLHNPEFTMVEWYRVGDTHHDQMTVTEILVKSVFGRASEWRAANGEDGLPQKDHAIQQSLLPGSASFERISYDAAFEKHLGTRVLHLSSAELADLARNRGIEPPPGLAADDRDGWRNLLLALLVEPQLGTDEPVFLYDYPASQSALARVRCDTGQPPVAERFELYLGGIELCNGYHELLDAEELRQRIDRQNEIRMADGLRTLPRHNRLLDAMDAGLPNCAGVALGLDRLIMCAAGKTSVSDVIAFPFDRA